MRHDLDTRCLDTEPGESISAVTRVHQHPVDRPQRLAPGYEVAITPRQEVVRREQRRSRARQQAQPDDVEARQRKPLHMDNVRLERPYAP